MLFILALFLLAQGVNAQLGLDFLNKGALDLNPAHQLCQPCIFAANTLKTTNKQPSVKETEKKTCNSLLKNEVVCNGAVEVAGIYLNWTPAEKICETIRLCGVVDGKRKIRAVPDEMARRVLRALESDEFPISQTRFARQADFAPELDVKKIGDFQKLLQEHFGEVHSALQTLLGRFKNAIQVYTDTTHRNFN